MSVRLPVYKYIGVDEFQMYPGAPEAPGIHHELTPGLHLIAGVNGLGKSTFLLLLYHGLVGPAAVRNDDFGVPQPEVAPNRDADRFRKRVADGAANARSEIHFSIGLEEFEVTRSLRDLTLTSWRLNGTEQVLDQDVYMNVVADAMNVGSFADVITILNLIVFMFESRGLLMWSPLAQRNALRALFTPPTEANLIAKRAQAVGAANSAYRNLLYIVNRDRRQLEKDKASLVTAGALGAEYRTLQAAFAAHNENHDLLIQRRRILDEARIESRSTYEAAKFNYDDILREIEALKLVRVASAFPKSEESSRYVITRLVGDLECLACGAEGGPLIEKWISTVSEGLCLICGSSHNLQEAIVPTVKVDTARLSKAERRLLSARQTLETSEFESKKTSEEYDQTQQELDKLMRDRAEIERRAKQISSTLLPSTTAIEAFEERLRKQEETLEQLRVDQVKMESEFSLVFGRFKASVEEKADVIRERFGRRISEFLVEKAEITLAYIRGPIGESGQSYEWPTFRLSMTSGAFDAPAPRRNRLDVSMSQGEFIDLAFRLALVETAAEATSASLIFDAPEASLDALFMRRAGAFLAQFTRENSENRLIVTSNLTNADMIPALFGAYKPQQGDPAPHAIPRSERRGRVIDLLKLAAPTRAISLVGDRYSNLLDEALFPPSGQAEPGL